MISNYLDCESKSTGYGLGRKLIDAERDDCMVEGEIQVDESEYK
jgi:hypothetical protein